MKSYFDGGLLQQKVESKTHRFHKLTSPLLGNRGRIFLCFKPKIIFKKPKLTIDICVMAWYIIATGKMVNAKAKIRIPI